MKYGKNNYLPEVKGDQRKLAEVSSTLEDVSPIDLEKEDVEDDVSLIYNLPGVKDYKIYSYLGNTFLFS